MLENQWIEMGTSRALLARLTAEQFAIMDQPRHTAAPRPDRTTLDLAQHQRMVAQQQALAAITVTDQYAKQVAAVVEPYVRYLESQDVSAVDELNRGCWLEDPGLVITGVQVEETRSGEFRPCSRMPGLYSFCVWLQVPNPGASHTLPWQMIPDRSGGWELHWLSSTGLTQITHVPVDSNFVGMIMVWPSRIAVTEYPFSGTDLSRWQVRGSMKLQDQ